MFPSFCLISFPLSLISFLVSFCNFFFLFSILYSFLSPVSFSHSLFYFSFLVLSFLSFFLPITPSSCVCIHLFISHIIKPRLSDWTLPLLWAEWKMCVCENMASCWFFFCRPCVVFSVKPPFFVFFQEVLLKRAADLVEALYGMPHNNQVREHLHFDLWPLQTQTHEDQWNIPSQTSGYISEINDE